MMRTAHLFSGAGGGILADLILGHRPVLAVEWEPSCCASLRERSEDGWMPGLHVHCGDIREFDFTPWRGRVDCIAAGFPCQDISAAGTGAGINGERSGLVSEVFRAVDAIRPGLVFLENSPRIRTRGRHIVIGELVARGYSWRDGRIAAADVGAPHKRERWFCLAANADGLRQLEQERRECQQRGWFSDGSEKAADYTGDGCGSRRAERQGQQGEVQLAGCAVQPAAGIDRTGSDWRKDGSGRNDTSRENAGGEKGSGRFKDGAQDASHPDPERRERRARDIPEQNRGDESENGDNDAADDLRHRLERAVQCGGLSAADRDSIQAAAGYTGAFHWSPPDTGLCRMVDGLADFLDGNTKRERIKACGNGQVPLQAAAAWVILSH